MKKLFVVLAAILFLAIVACSSGGGGANSGSTLTAKQIEEIENSSNSITNKLSTAADPNSATALEDAKTYALTLTNVQSADVIEGTLVVKYKDAGQEVWLLNTPKFDTPDYLSALKATSKSSILKRLDSTTKVEKASTGTVNAVLINALDEDPEFSSSKDFFTEIYKILGSKGYNVKSLYGPNASPENMKDLSNYSVIIMLGHGGNAILGSYGAYGVMTGKPWDDSWKTTISDWIDNRYFKMTVPWETGDYATRWQNHRSFYALTGQFWKDSYASSHFNNALFINLACSSSKYEAYRDDLFSVGVTAYTGWSDETNISMNHAYYMLISMSEGKTFKEANEGLPSNLKTGEMIDESSGKSITSTLWYGPESGYSLTLQSSSAVYYSMSGTIHIGSNSGVVLSGATVSIAGLTATTGSAGTFTITGIPAGTYAFSVSKSGYDTYTNSAYYIGSDQTGLNFYLTQSSTSGDYTSANIGTLKYVPAGSFQRDSTSTNISTVSAFRMSQYEITRAQFLAIIETDPSDATYSSGTSDPVQMVTWYDAVEFCNKLSIAEGLTPVYTITGRTPATGYPITDASVTPTWANNGYRLPTEMEWMWAAMGATAGATGYLKAFAGSTGSNSIGDYAWTWENSSVNHKSQPVGTKLPNELGLYDMSGNIEEWNWDWYGAPPTGIQTNYRGAASGAYRVIRGGSWNSYASYATVAYRDCYYHPHIQYIYFGFRVVRP